MDLSELIINEIKEADVYYDRKSKDPNLNRPRKKYKVFFGKIKDIDIFIFYVFNTSKDVCKKRYRLCVLRSDLIERNPCYLKNECSYIDASKPDILSKDELKIKINDRYNRFKKVAILCKAKFSKLIKLAKKSTSQIFGSERIKRKLDLVEVVLKETSDEVIKKFDIG